MSLPNYLAKIQSGGIYRFVWDKSEIPGQQAETLRLVVGYSEKGPFNTPVYVESPADFRTIFGGVSKKLERYGVWFHRMAIQALKKGPILALNIKPFDEEKVQGVSFNPQDGILGVDLNGDLNAALELAVTDIYNIRRLCTLEQERFEDIPSCENQYISIFATDSKEASNTIFVRGYQPTGYDVTIKEWYSSVLNGEEIPSYLEGHENDYLSQYWAEIFVFKGQFTASIASSDKLAKFFNVNQGKVTLKPYIPNAFGEKLDTLTQLAANESSNFVQSYRGILLPDFLSSTNTVISLDAQFNADNYKHKMLMRLNQTLLYNEDIPVSQLDTTGWTKAFQSTKRQVMSLHQIDPQVSVATYGVNGWSYANPVIDGQSVDFYDFSSADIQDGPDDYSVTISKYMGSTGTSENNKFLFRKNGEDIVANLVKIQTNQVTTGQFFEDNKGIEGDAGADYEWKSKLELGANTVDVTNTVAKYAARTDNEVLADLARAMRVLHNEDPVGHETVTYNGKIYYWDLRTKIEGGVAVGLKGSNYVQHDANGDVAYDNGPDHKMLTLVHDATADFGAYVGTDTSKIEGYKIEVEFADGCKSKTTFHVDNAYDATTDAGIVDNTNAQILVDYTYTFDKEVVGVDWTLGGQVSFVKCVNNTTYTSANMFPTYLEGYTYMNDRPASSKQWDKLQWQHNILNVMTQYKGIRTALTDRVSVDYRYIVDTFEGFVENECKARIAIIAKEKDNAFALLNFPAMTSFEKCPYTSFLDNNGIFDTKYIRMGGNPQKMKTVSFSLVSEENGDSYVSYNTCLSMRDVNTGIKFVCPPAALVSNLYMDKYTKYFPYTIVAGPNRAVITESGLIGPDFNFSREDLDNLEPFGVNAMVMVPGKGTYINSNQTAKQNPVTTLSKINVRELCIFLQDEIENLLQQYQWDFNTPNLRSTIKDRADVILETAKNNGGVYRYLNVCDKSNNTDEIINNEFFILSTSIEPGLGAGKMVQELTLYRKGGMSSVIKTY